MINLFLYYLGKSFGFLWEIVIFYFIVNPHGVADFQEMCTHTVPSSNSHWTPNSQYFRKKLYIFEWEKHGIQFLECNNKHIETPLTRCMPIPYVWNVNQKNNVSVSSSWTGDTNSTWTTTSSSKGKKEAIVAVKSFSSCCTGNF